MSLPWFKSLEDLQHLYGLMQSSDYKNSLGLAIAAFEKVWRIQPQHGDEEKWYQITCDIAGKREENPEKTTLSYSLFDFLDGLREAKQKANIAVNIYADLIAKGDYEGHKFDDDMQDRFLRTLETIKTLAEKGIETYKKIQVVREAAE